MKKLVFVALTMLLLLMTVSFSAHAEDGHSTVLYVDIGYFSSIEYFGRNCYLFRNHFDAQWIKRKHDYEVATKGG